jgi:hypothetical protein
MSMQVIPFPTLAGKWFAGVGEWTGIEAVFDQNGLPGLACWRSSRRRASIRRPRLSMFARTPDNRCESAKRMTISQANTNGSHWVGNTNASTTIANNCQRFSDGLVMGFIMADLR